MSMNVYIYVEIKAINCKTKKLFRTTEKFRAWQTPTEETYKIVRSDDPIRSYCDWVLSVSKEEQVERYAPDDIFSEGPVIGYDTRHSGKEHIAELMAWVERMREVGDVKVEVI